DPAIRGHVGHGDLPKRRGGFRLGRYLMRSAAQRTVACEPCPPRTWRRVATRLVGNLIMAEIFVRGLEVHGTLVEQREGQIVLALPGTDYRLHLAVDGPLTPGVGGRVHGVIRAQARRVDVTRTG